MACITLGGDKSVLGSAWRSRTIVQHLSGISVSWDGSSALKKETKILFSTMVMVVHTCTTVY